MIKNNYIDYIISLLFSEKKKNIYNLQTRAIEQLTDIKNYVYLLLSDASFMRTQIGKITLNHNQE